MALAIEQKHCTGRSSRCNRFFSYLITVRPFFITASFGPYDVDTPSERYCITLLSIIIENNARPIFLITPVPVVVTVEQSIFSKNQIKSNVQCIAYGVAYFFVYKNGLNMGCMWHPTPRRPVVICAMCQLAAANCKYVTYKHHSHAVKAAHWYNAISSTQ